MLAHLLQKPRDWYGGNVQFPVGHSIITDLLFGLSVRKRPEYMAPDVPKGTLFKPGEEPLP